MPFKRFLALGYRRLVSITPHDCEVSPKSTLAKRLGDRGKAPGVRRSDGLWQGYDWINFEPTPEHYEAWEAAGAGVGIRTGEGLLAVDIDTLDPALADTAARAAVEILGPSVNRVGRAPKRLKLYRTAPGAALAYQRVTFDGGHVELLGDGRQFVAHGVHPATGKPYEWPSGVPAYDDLAVVDAERIARFVARLEEALPAAKAEKPAGSTAQADPGQLAGRHDDVVRAVRALPNDDRFGSYQRYIEVAQAIKGALPDDDEAGLELFQEWASRWTGGDNDPERVAADWRRCQPSRSLGAQYLYHLASTHGSGDFSPAEAWFSPAAELNPFAVAEQAAPPLEPIRWVSPSAWTGEPPERQWEVRDWIPKGEVVLLYGEGGVGKTLLAHQYAVAAATGQSWLAQETRPAKVMCFFCEDGEDELWRRHRDISRHLGVEPGASDARLRVASRKYADNLLALWDRNTGAMKRTAIWQQLRDDAEAFGADVIVVDTLADTFGGSEIDRAQVNSFVKSCLGRLAAEVGCTVLALGHPSVGGRAEGRSGSTAWSNAARARMYLRYPKGREEGNWRELEGMKLNYGPKGAQIRLRWQAGAFRAQSARTPEIDPGALKSGEAAPPAALPAIEDVAQAAVLEALRLAEEDRLPLSLSPRSSTYAGRVLKQLYAATLGMVHGDEIPAAIVALEKAGRVRVATWRGSGRNAVTGYALAQPGNVFG